MITVSTNASTHLFWVLSRGAGTTAMILSSASVGVGLVMSGKLLKGSSPDRRVYHEILSLAVMVAIAAHGLALVGDSFLHPSVLDVTVPFIFSYKTLSTSLGIIAGWGMIILGLSFYARKRIGIARWKIIHRFTAVAWLMGLVHTFAEGTDAGKLWFIALIGLTAGPVLGLLVLRHGRHPAASGAQVVAAGGR
jgi:methionine sulfoxide reductase heme-binding subunit